MATLLVRLCGVTAVAAFGLVVYFLLTRASDLLPKLLVCFLLLDLSIVTILHLSIPAVVPPLRLAVRIGSVGVLIAGVLLVVWNALPRQDGAEAILNVLAFAMILQGALTWRYLSVAREAEERAAAAKSEAKAPRPGGSR